MRIKGIGIDRASAPKIHAVGGCDANEDENLPTSRQRATEHLVLDAR